MGRTLLLLMLVCLSKASFGQFVYTIKADSVKITNCDSAELILENHTQGVPGFLFNTGNGRTVFKRGLQKISDSLYIIGADSLKLRVDKAWLQGGNRFGTTGVLGTLDSNHLDLYTNSARRARLTNTGNFLIGGTTDNGSLLQVAGNTWISDSSNAAGGLPVYPHLSRAGDVERFGGAINSGDGQNIMLSASSDNGVHFRNTLVERDGYIGIGNTDVPADIGFNVGSPTLRINSSGIFSIASSAYFFGNTGGPFNSSGLLTTVSNTNEWHQGSGAYPSGQNYYYFGTTLGNPEAGNVRAPLRISGRELDFLTGAAESQAAELSQAGNMLVGTATDDGHRLQVNGSVRFESLTQDSTQVRVLVSDTSGNIYYRSASSLAMEGLLPASLAGDRRINSSLAVNGTITAHRLRLKEDAWPDYVFGRDYRLPSLEEIEDYIRQYGHLPGMSPAREAESKGIDVGDQQAALLKKIEELTLYAIGQEKTLREQAERLRQQDGEIAELKEKDAEIGGLKAKDAEIGAWEAQHKEIEALRLEMIELKKELRRRKPSKGSGVRAHD